MSEQASNYPSEKMLPPSFSDVIGTELRQEYSTMPAVSSGEVLAQAQDITAIVEGKAARYQDLSPGERLAIAKEAYCIDEGSAEWQELSSTERELAHISAILLEAPHQFELQRDTTRLRNLKAGGAEGAIYEQKREMSIYHDRLRQFIDHNPGAISQKDLQHYLTEMVGEKDGNVIHLAKIEWANQLVRGLSSEVALKNMLNNFKGADLTAFNGFEVVAAWYGDVEDDMKGIDLFVRLRDIHHSGRVVTIAVDAKNREHLEPKSYDDVYIDRNQLVEVEPGVRYPKVTILVPERAIDNFELDRRASILFRDELAITAELQYQHLSLGQKAR